MKAPLKRCAIYTRKSSDEGLDQAFNSLDAQREAGEAYVKSQASEGWAASPTRYDDGGFSGGSMERPALQKLLADIDAGRIDVVVVYKIDRLTRSLADFARIVEAFDARGVSFVSVTQAFNTTSSMGRLTLNVLLSFAQFEREVTGERIRDKIAASKAKGFWMGGLPPLGYDPPPVGAPRGLVVNDAEAEVVRSIFSSYLEIGSVHALERYLVARGITSKTHVTVRGKTLGGLPFSRGAIFHLLRNRVYRGQIVHRDEVYDGIHEAIVDAALFEKVQDRLSANTRRTITAKTNRVVRAPLTGKLYDANGHPMSPTHSRGRSGRLYRYYVSAPLQQGFTSKGSDAVRRVSATTIERAVGELVSCCLPEIENAIRMIARVEIFGTALHLLLPAKVKRHLAAPLPQDVDVEREGEDGAMLRIVAAGRIARRGGRTVIAQGDAPPARPDASLIKALRRSRAMIDQGGDGMPVANAAPPSPYLRRLMRLAFLAPDLQRDILAGHQPEHLSLERLMAIDIPISWARQREALGWDR